MNNVHTRDASGCQQLMNSVHFSDSAPHFDRKFTPKPSLLLLNYAMHPAHIRTTKIAFVLFDFRHYIGNRTQNGVDTMNVIGSFRKWRNYRRTVSELSSLSNRELDDLGIARGDIPHVARGTR